MKTTSELRTQALRYWASGDYHRDRLVGHSWQPLVLATGVPAGRDLLRDFSALRTTVIDLQALDGKYFQLNWESIRHRQLGDQRLPTHVSFTSEDSWLAFIGHTSTAARFKQLCSVILAAQPRLQALLEAKPHFVLEHEESWQQFLAIADWFITHPRPGVYLRQIDLPGIDTKFIEQNRAILAAILDTLLPPEAIDQTVRGLSQHGFERRYGLLFDEPLIRFRLLEQSIAGLNDLTVPASQFAALRLPVRRVFITENKVNGLAFPQHCGAMVIFGLGYGLDTLFDIPWLQHVEIFYWGDLDTHGFAMLARMRQHFPQVRSILMDTETLATHWQLHGEEATPFSGEEPVPLTSAESETYRRLKLPDGRVARIEQERLSYPWVLAQLSNL